MTFDLKNDCIKCGQEHHPATLCEPAMGFDLARRRTEPAPSPRPYDYMPADTSNGVDDLIVRNWECNAQAMHGWGAQTGVQAMHVLATLMNHMHEQGDAVGMQILGRVWRMNSPVLEHLTYGQKRSAEMHEGLQQIGSILDLQVGDDVATVAPPKLRQLVAEATLLRETLAMCERETPAVMVVAKHDPNTASVHLQSLKGEVTFAARSLRGALQLAVDGEREVKRNG